MKSLLQSMTDFDLVDEADRFVRKLNKLDKERASRSGFIKKTTFAPSKIGAYEGACSRYWYYAFKGTDGKDEPGYQGMRYMEAGTDRHARFEKLLTLLDEEAVVEEEFWSQDPPVHGFIDGQVEWNNVDWIIEFKGTGAGSFKKIRASGKPKPYHLIQMGLYMYIKGYSHGMLVYECRDTFKLFAVPVKMHHQFDKYIRYVVGWLNEVYRLVNEEDALPPRCFSQKSWQCKGCPFSDTCWADERTPDTDLGKLKEFKF